MEVAIEGLKGEIMSEEWSGGWRKRQREGEDDFSGVASPFAVAASSFLEAPSQLGSIGSLMLMRVFNFRPV